MTTRLPTNQDNDSAWGSGNSYPRQPSIYQPPQAPAKKKRKVFFWFFVAVQVLFIIWIIAGLANTAHTDVSNCQGFEQTCRDAANTGRAIGVGLIVGFWVAFDVIVGGTYAVYRLVKSRG